MRDSGTLRFPRKLVIAMATRTTLTLDQFRELPEREDGTNYELSQGELITLPPPGYKHGAIMISIAALLKNTLPKADYIVAGGDAGFLLDPNPEAATVRGADVAVNRRMDVGENLPTGWFPGAPLLAIEVVSPSNTAKDMQLKVKQYLEGGALEVWLVYPDTRTLYVYSAGRRDPRVFEEGDTFQSVVDQTFRVEDLFRI
jgi:Uma2 family endonuclease